ncbi:hypothetical protein M8818_004896 [Zalaria obscura]|uniref:Uncharacterized protein n=1 Tax=Zalaria obscura TaxID=2024903 RepID=A0ACC3SAU0_9PEZI
MVTQRHVIDTTSLDSDCGGYFARQKGFGREATNQSGQQREPFTIGRPERPRTSGPTELDNEMLHYCRPASNPQVEIGLLALPEESRISLTSQQVVYYYAAFRDHDR